MSSVGKQGPFVFTAVGFLRFRRRHRNTHVLVFVFPLGRRKLSHGIHQQHRYCAQQERATNGKKYLLR